MKKHALAVVFGLIGTVIGIQSFASPKPANKASITELPKSLDTSGNYYINSIVFDKEKLIVDINVTFKSLCEDSSIKVYNEYPTNQVVLGVYNNQKECPQNITRTVKMKLLEFGLVGSDKSATVTFGFESEPQKDEYGRGKFVPQFTLEVPPTKKRFQRFTTEYRVDLQERTDLAVQLSEQGQPQMVLINVDDNGCSSRSKYQISLGCTRRGTISFAGELADISNTIDDIKYESNTSVLAVKEAFQARMFDHHESKLELVFRKNILTRVILTNLRDDTYLSSIVRRVAEDE